MITDTRNMDNVRMLTAALRSGDYEQGRLKLKRLGFGDTEAFCCLGVACDISGLGTWKPTINERWDDYVIYNENGVYLEKNENLLPSAVAKWLGIHEGGAFRFAYTFLGRTQHTQFTLTDLNDSGEFTFSMIADVLESEAIEFLPPGVSEFDN